MRGGGCRGKKNEGKVKPSALAEGKTEQEAFKAGRGEGKKAGESQGKKGPGKDLWE